MRRMYDKNQIQNIAGGGGGGEGGSGKTYHFINMVDNAGSINLTVLLDEAEQFTSMEDFQNYIYDNISTFTLPCSGEVFGDTAGYIMSCYSATSAGDGGPFIVQVITSSGTQVNKYIFSSTTESFADTVRSV